MSATKQTEREKALEAERDDYKAKHEQAEAERDDYKTRYEDARTAHNEARVAFEQADEARQQAEAQRDQLLDEVTKPSTTPTGTEPADVDPHADAKAALRLNKLERCFLMPDGHYCFDEAHARKFMGEQFESLTVISAE